MSVVDILEHIVVTLSLEVECRGDTVIQIKSPRGTVSTLLDKRENDLSTEKIEKFSFLSVHLWGESLKFMDEWNLSIEGTAR